MAAISPSRCPWRSRAPQSLAYEVVLAAVQRSRSPSSVLQTNSQTLKPGKLLAKGCVVRRFLRQAHDDGMTVLEGCNRFAPSALPNEHRRNAAKAQCKGSAPISITRVGLD